MRQDDQRHRVTLSHLEQHLGRQLDGERQRSRLLPRHVIRDLEALPQRLDRRIVRVTQSRVAGRLTVPFLQARQGVVNLRRQRLRRVRRLQEEVLEGRGLQPVEAAADDVGAAAHDADHVQHLGQRVGGELRHVRVAEHVHRNHAREGEERVDVACRHAVQLRPEQRQRGGVVPQREGGVGAVRVGRGARERQVQRADGQDAVQQEVGLERELRDQLPPYGDRALRGGDQSVGFDGEVVHQSQVVALLACEAGLVLVGGGGGGGEGRG